MAKGAIMRPLFSRWRDELADLQSSGGYRKLRPPIGHDFSSNDYLGYGATLSANDNALSRSGVASRLLRGDHPLWTDVEAALAKWHRAAAALIFNSGYVANEGLLSAVIEPDAWVASDQFNHASIIDGLRLTKATRFIYPHNDPGRLEEGLRSSASKTKFIVTESLFGMEGDVAPLAEIAALARRFDAHLIVDEAHATGCFGATGGGLVDALGLRDDVLATMHTGGKALGVPGAYVVGSSLLKEWLVNRCRHLIFTTALPPRIAVWWLDALSRVAEDHDGRERLRANAAVFRAKLAGHCDLLGSRHIAPIRIGDEARTLAIAESLQAAGFDVRAIRPPTVPKGESRLRVSIHADHSAELIATLATHLRDALGRFP